MIELWTIVAAVWGGIWTLNSAISAFLQTKWMYDQRQILKKMSTTLDSIRDLNSLQVGDDIQKMDPMAVCAGDDFGNKDSLESLLQGDSHEEQYTCGCDDQDCPYCSDEEETK